MNTLNAFESPTGSPQVIPIVAESLHYVSERMGKITQAVVLISTVVHDDHQLCADLIRYATQALREIYQIESDPEYATTKDVFGITTSLRHVSHIAELCHTARLISDMNYQIINNEVGGLSNYVQEKLMTYCIGHVQYPFRIPESESGTQSVNQVSLETYFSPQNTFEKKTTPAPIIETKQTIQPKENITHHISDISIKQISERPIIKDNLATTLQKISYKPSANEYQKPTHHQAVPISVKPISGEDKKDRRDAIMKTIRSKGQVTIRDISKNIHGCSEKTIQRDLQELIQHGVLIREGEKRWAVYKLAMNNV